MVRVAEYQTAEEKLKKYQIKPTLLFIYQTGLNVCIISLLFSVKTASVNIFHLSDVFKNNDELETQNPESSFNLLDMQYVRIVNSRAKIKFNITL